MKTRALMRLVVTVSLLAPLLLSASSAEANINGLTVHRRTCSQVTAYVNYDGFSGGTAPYFIAFTVDLDNDGVFGEVGEPTQFAQVSGNGTPLVVGRRLTFRNQREGTFIAVTAYEVDSEGFFVGGPLEPVRYSCTNRPALNATASNTGITPQIAVVARVFVNRVEVYREPSASSALIGGLALGQQVDVLARNARNDWVQIRFGGGTGWIMWQTQVRLSGAFSQLPVVP
ncbi:MAG: SH3 domain-containing protein [Anaerolineae bacterium]|nr:SH3 domain-containing protein [Anaerolineae bacterium]